MSRASLWRHLKTLVVVPNIPWQTSTKQDIQDEIDYEERQIAINSHINKDDETDDDETEKTDSELLYNTEETDYDTYDETDDETDDDGFLYDSDEDLANFTRRNHDRVINMIMNARAVASTEREFEHSQENTRGLDMYYKSIILKKNHDINKIRSINRSEEIEHKSDLLIDRVNESCIICFDPMEDYHIFPCKHRFHKYCIKKLYYLYKDNKCPMCRRKHIYNPRLNKKQRRKLKNIMIQHHSNEFGRMKIVDFIHLHKFIDESCGYMPNWMKNIFPPLYSCLKDNYNMNLYVQGYINIKHKSDLLIGRNQSCMNDLHIYTSDRPYVDEFDLYMTRREEECRFFNRSTLQINPLMDLPQNLRYLPGFYP